VAFALQVILRARAVKIVMPLPAVVVIRAAHPVSLQGGIHAVAAMSRQIPKGKVKSIPRTALADACGVPTGAIVRHQPKKISLFSKGTRQTIGDGYVLPTIL